MITAYDATFARLASEAGAETILVGDSLGMVLQARNHYPRVARCDGLPHGMRRTSKAALIDRRRSALYEFFQLRRHLAREHTTHAGRRTNGEARGGTWLSDSIHRLVERGVPVCAHLGLTPQSVNVFGGYRVQGRTPKEAKSILADAVEIQDAGASLLVLECIPADLAADISSKLDIPVIGIGLVAVQTHRCWCCMTCLA